MRPSFLWLPAWPWAVWSSTAVDHRMTFRGLPADCHEVFSADHRLTFRGLPAEGLGAQTHEATSPSTPPAGASGVPCRENGRASPRHRVTPPIVAALHGRRPPIVSPLFQEEARPPIARLSRTLEGSSCRGAGEPSWFTPPGRSPPRRVLPACLPPLAAAALVPKGLGEGSHRPADGVSAVPGPNSWSVVSWTCRHGSSFGMKSETI